MLKAWRDFMDTVDSTTRFFRGLLWMVTIIMAIGIIIRQWLSSLDTLQIVFLVIGLLCICLIGFTYYFDWRRKKSVDNIPDLLSQIDQLTLDYIDNSDLHSDKPQELLDDLGKLLNMDVSQLKRVALERNKEEAQYEFQRFTDRYSKYLNPSKTTKKDTVWNLLLIGSTLNEYGVGLANITDTEEYKKLYDRVKNLQRQVPTAEINMKINAYFNGSRGLYSTLLSTKPIEGELRALIPIRIRASNGMLRNIIEGQTAILISEVRESVQASKGKGRETEQSSHKSK